MATAAYTRGYRPYDFTDFSGGLNLRDKADTVDAAQAIDLLNVQFSERGAISQRDGYEDFLDVDLTEQVGALAPFYTAAGLRHLIAGSDTRLEAINYDGALVQAQTGLGDPDSRPWTFARFADPLHEWIFAANARNPLQRWDGLNWSPANGMIAKVDGVDGRELPRCGAVTVTAAHPGTAAASNAANRLVATAFPDWTTGAGPGNAQSSVSRVYFSNAGQPLEWETDGLTSAGRARNWIDLTPGDGERIQAAVTWRELVFIFKETKFFVLWGEGVQLVGDEETPVPTFQVREVVNAIGLASPQAVAVGRDGVYFMNRRGVYRTNGADPVLLSDVISPMWTQNPDVYFKSSPINLAMLPAARMMWHQERLYLAVPTGDRDYCDRVLVYDTQHQWWTLYDLPASALASFRSSDIDAVHFGYSAGDQRIGRLLLGRNHDRVDSVIASRWRSGWSDYETPQQKTFRETRVWGAGAVTTSFSTDYHDSQRTQLPTIFAPISVWPVDGAGSWDEWLETTNDLWPGAGQISDRLIRHAVRGATFSTQFANSPRAPTWSVHRVTRHLREIREPSVTT